MKVSSLNKQLFLAVLLGVIVLLVYGVTLTHGHSADDLQWIGQVERSVSGARRFHPASMLVTAELGTDANLPTPNLRYFLELPTSSIMYRIFKDSDPNHLAARPVQWGHVFFGIIGIVFFYLAMAQFLSPGWSFVLSLGVAASYAWWYYSTHLDYTIASHAFSAVLLYALVALLRSTTRNKILIYSVVLGIASAFVILYLITGIVLVPLVLLALILHGRQIPELKIYGVAGVYLVVLVLTGVLLFVGSSAGYGGAPQILAQLSSDVSYSGATAHDFSLLDIPKSWYGFAKSLSVFPGLNGEEPSIFMAAQGTLGKGAVVGWYGLIMVVVIVPFVGLIALRKRLDPHTLLIAILTLWFLTYFPFAIYWEPTYIKWWTGALLPWWGLVGLVLAVSGLAPRFYKPYAAFIVGLVMVIAGANLISDFLPRSQLDNNQWLKLAEAIGADSIADDLFFAPTSGQLLDFYLPYFENRRTLSYPLILAQEGRDEELATTLVNDYVRSVMDQGNRVFIYNCNERSIPDWQTYFRDVYGINLKVIANESWNFDEGIAFCEVGLSDG